MEGTRRGRQAGQRRRRGRPSARARAASRAGAGRCCPAGGRALLCTLSRAARRPPRLEHDLIHVIPCEPGKDGLIGGAQVLQADGQQVGSPLTAARRLLERRDRRPVVLSRRGATCCHAAHSSSKAKPEGHLRVPLPEDTAPMPCTTREGRSGGIFLGGGDRPLVQIARPLQKV